MMAIKITCRVVDPQASPVASTYFKTNMHTIASKLATFSLKDENGTT